MDFSVFDFGSNQLDYWLVRHVMLWFLSFLSDSKMQLRLKKRCEKRLFKRGKAMSKDPKTKNKTKQNTA